MELKWKYLDELYREKYFDKDVPQVYLKSEADRYIANLNEQIRLLKNSMSNFLKTNIEDVEREVMRKTLIYGEGLIPVEHAMRLVAEIRRYKYKRCLAMAKWCDEVMMSCELRGYTVHRIWANKHRWAMRWKYRWLKLAEQFKPNKE